MANKRFPADMSDITADYVYLMAVKADGTVGTATPCLARSGGTIAGSTINPFNISTSSPDGLYTEYASNSIPRAYAGTENNLFIGGSIDTFAITGASGKSLSFGTSNTLRYSISAGGDNVWTGSGVFGGTVTANGVLLTSMREKKHVKGKFNEDALSQVNALKLHKFSYRKFKQVEKEPAKVDKKGKVTKAAVVERVELPASKNDPLNIGVMYDEVVDNPNIATKEGSINLHNLVFLQARAIQQLTERLQALENATQA